MPIVIRYDAYGPIAANAQAVGAERLRQQLDAERLRNEQFAQQQAMNAQQMGLAADNQLLAHQRQDFAQQQAGREMDLRQQAMSLQGDRLDQSGQLGVARLIADAAKNNMLEQGRMDRFGQQQDRLDDRTRQTISARMAWLKEQAQIRQLNDEEKRQFQADQNALDRDLRLTMQTNQQDFTGTQNDLNRAIRQSDIARQIERDKAITAQTAQRLALAQTQDERKAAMAELDYQVKIAQQNLRAAQAAKTAYMGQPLKDPKIITQLDEDIAKAMEHVNTVQSAIHAALPQNNAPVNLWGAVQNVGRQAQVTIGQIITNSAGQRAQVVGYDANGQPMVQPLA